MRIRIYLDRPRAEAHVWGIKGAHPHRDQQITMIALSAPAKLRQKLVIPRSASSCRGEFPAPFLSFSVEIRRLQTQIRRKTTYQRGFRPCAAAQADGNLRLCDWRSILSISSFFCVRIAISAKSPRRSASPISARRSLCRLSIVRSSSSWMALSTSPSSGGRVSPSSASATRPAERGLRPRPWGPGPGGRRAPAAPESPRGSK